MSSLVIARLNDRARPMDRGERYEDPLNDVLEKRELGEVTGGGTQLGAQGEVVFCDVEILLREAPTDETLKLLAETLESFGAPIGSKLMVDEKREVPFGKTEGLAVYLNGTDLPAETYESTDVNFVFEEFHRLLEKEGSLHSYWEGPRETALYMYGPSYDRMAARLKDFIDSYPLCHRARLVKIA